MQTGIGDCNRRDVSLPAIVHCHRLLQTLFNFAAAESVVLLLLVLPLFAPVGCLSTEQALLVQGEDLLVGQEYEGASLLFSRYVLLCPDAPQGYFDRGIAYRGLGKLQRAEEDLEKAILLDPRNMSYRWARFQLLQLRYENLQASTAAPFERPAWETLKSALSTLMMMDLQQILRLDPHDVSARLEYASLLSLRGSLEEAMKELDRSVLEAPFDPGVRNDRGRLLHEMGRYADAIEDYDMALRYCESCTLVKYNKGLSLKKYGRVEEAAATFQEVVTEDSLDGGAWFNLGEVQILLGRRDEGCVSLQKSLSLGIPEARDLYEELCR